MIYKKICINIIFTASTSATIVITTHYIEEARQAHRVGLGSSRVSQRVGLGRSRVGDSKGRFEQVKVRQVYRVGLERSRVGSLLG